MPPLILAPRGLTAETFAPYGRVVAAPEGEGRLFCGEMIENRRADAKLDFSLTTVAHRQLPLALRLFERHAFSSQCFMPLNVARYLVAVCPDDGNGRPDTGRATAFIATADHGVVYAPGTWHHPMTALDRPGRFAIVMWACGDAGDEELVPLDRTIEVRSD